MPCKSQAHRSLRLGELTRRATRRNFGWLFSLALTPLLLAGTPASSNAQTTTEPTSVTGQFGDWQRVCKRPTGAAQDICALVQDVTSESNPNVGLSVHFQRAPDGQRVLRVFAPLGILLPPGLGLQVDDTKVGHVPFVRCHVVGCFAQVTLTPDLVGQFQAGKTAWFIVFQSQEEGIGIPISLAGFTAALSALDGS